MLSNLDGSGFTPVPLIVRHLTAGSPVVEYLSCNEFGGIGSTPKLDGFSPLSPKTILVKFDKIPVAAIVIVLI
jgi:hypothetical protein